MKLKNDKTNPFPGGVTLLETVTDFIAGADQRSAAHKVLSFAVNTAQKIHNITGEMTKLGTPKNEQTKPLKTGIISTECQANQRLKSNRGPLGGTPIWRQKTAFLIDLFSNERIGRATEKDYSKSRRQ